MFIAESQLYVDQIKVVTWNSFVLLCYHSFVVWVVLWDVYIRHQALFVYSLFSGQPIHSKHLYSCTHGKTGVMALVSSWPSVNSETCSAVAVGKGLGLNRIQDIYQIYPNKSPPLIPKQPSMSNAVIFLYDTLLE